MFDQLFPTCVVQFCDGKRVYVVPFVTARLYVMFPSFSRVRAGSPALPSAAGVGLLPLEGS